METTVVAFVLRSHYCHHHRYRHHRHHQYPTDATLVCVLADINPLKGTLKPQSNGPLYSNTVITTLAVDGWAVTFGTARRGLGGLGPRPVPSSLYQMQQPTHQWPMYQLRIV